MSGIFCVIILHVLYYSLPIQHISVPWVLHTPHTSIVFLRRRGKRTMTRKTTFFAFHHSIKAILSPPDCQLIV